ncbi:WecB/TagA/CpsF family glycosyltransferase [uncultured Fenollaria sp.]|uniref:WecB/TagA/CpsF family glycosyltransferase n=1 Tax=uncultured Fenollaria sp. TaxID=1686315 RepID=UPI0025F2ECD6|nr:WecB/TagA/CpsF family glycosyltransferase [uncultured Fenollaria sp.]
MDIKILGVRINNVDMDQTMNKIGEFFNNDELNYIYTPNPEIVMRAGRDEEFKKIINSASLNLCDGIGLMIASKLKKKPLKSRVTGYDTSIKILELMNEKHLSLFLLGAKPGIAEKAIEKINNDYPNIVIAGYNNGYFNGSHNDHASCDEEEALIQKINDSKTDAIFVGMGAGYQEKFIYYNKDKLKSKLAIANGGVIDVLAGNVKIAPAFIRKIGMEWLYRLIKEPKRFKRQLDIPKFLMKIIFTKNAVEYIDKE